MVKSIYEYIDYLEANFSEKTAFRWYDEETQSIFSKTFSEYVSDIRKFASGLRLMDPSFSGKHAGIMADNSYDSIVAVLGVMVAGGVSVLLNPNESWDVLENEIKLADLSCVIVIDEAQIDRFRLEIEEVISIVEAKSVSEKVPECIISFDRYRNPDETIIMIFTSGTTGQNKGAMLSFENILSMIRYYESVYPAILSNINVSELYDILLMPIYHIAGLDEVLFFSYFGSCSYLSSSVKYIYRDLKISGANYLPVPPMVLEQFYSELVKGNSGKLGKLRLILTGGAYSNHEMIDTFSCHDILVLDVYGMTETTGIAAMSVAGEKNRIRKMNSVGKCGKDVSVSIRDGEICFKGDVVFKGYYNDPKANEEAFDKEGWYHSGDLGYLDDEGYLFITGRKKNLIILSDGENVSPEKLENLLLENSIVKEVLIYEEHGKICAEIFSDTSCEENLKIYIREVNRTLPMYSRITMVRFRNEPFLRTASGKIKRG